VAVVNPARINAQRGTEQTRTKTDRVDAFVILRFFKSQYADLFWWQPPTPAILELQSLVRYRERCVSSRTAEQNFVHSRSAHPKVIAMAIHRIDELTVCIEEVEQMIEKLIAANEALSKFLEMIASINGIAETTAAILIAECRGFVEIRNARQATAFAGLDVIKYESGSIRRPPRISKQGNALLRMAFVRIAPSACARKGIWRELYRKFIAKGLHKRQAHCAIARKMLEVAVAVAVSGKKYDPEKHATALGLNQSLTAA
jgi:transposase